jgi:hypothetical protein
MFALLSRCRSRARGVHARGVHGVHDDRGVHGGHATTNRGDGFCRDAMRKPP